MATKDKKPKSVPAQHQDKQPGIESEMHPQPEYIRPGYKGSGKLMYKVAIVTGGDSGIGRAVAVHFAHEGAHVAIAYLREHGDAKKTKLLVEAAGVECLLMAGDLGDLLFCKRFVAATIKKFGRLDVLVNNAAEQH